MLVGRMARGETAKRISNTFFSLKEGAQEGLLTVMRAVCTVVWE